jgi:hypothetical protein
VSKIGQPIPLIKACEQNKYVDYETKYPGNTCFSIPYSLTFRQRYFQLGASEADLEEIQFPNNLIKSEDLAERVVGQPDDKFKNKKQVLFNSQPKAQVPFTNN